MSVMSKYEHGQFSWVDLSAHDMATARDFYAQLWGWNCVDQDTQGGPPYGQFELNGQIIAGIGQMNEEMKAGGVPPMWNSYINVADVDAVTARAAELGGSITVPVIDVLDAGRLSFVQDPTGAQIGFWQAKQHIGATLVIEPGSFSWNELATRDIERAKTFYAELLGWEYEGTPESPSPYFVIKNRGQDNGGIMQMTSEWGDMPACWTVYFSAANIDNTVDKLRELGGNVMQPPFDIPVGRLSIVADAQGAAFNIIQLSST